VREPMKYRIADSAPYMIEIDFYEPKPRRVNYRFFVDVNKLTKWLENMNDRIWRPKIDNFTKWLKEYRDVIDLGYLVLFDEKGEIERIVNIHIHYSVWLQRPALRIVEIAEFTSEWFEDED
jgi:hypothetical protein